MPNTTTNHSFNKPLVNDATDEDLWGGYLNDNWDSLDSILPTPAASKYGALCVQSTNDTEFEILSNQGTSGQILTSNGADALPTFEDNPNSSATTSAEGIVELLTDAEFATGTDSTRAVVASNFVKSLSQNGYITLAGGLLIQWGYYTGGSFSPTINFPTAFGTSCWSIQCTAYDGTSLQSLIATVQSFSNSQFNAELYTRNGGSSAKNFFWIAIGK